MEDKAKVVFENGNILVVNKRAGVVSTNEGRKGEGSLEDWLSRNRGDNGLPRQGIVHRLDKGTSGLMVVAKNSQAREKLMTQFKKRRVEKEYLALAGGDLPLEGEIRMPTGRSRYSFGRFAVREDGKKAETEFKTIKKYQYLGKVYSLVSIKIKSGRTHQIRVHLSYLGWPLVGDKLYGSKENMGLARPFLQAKKIAFEEPITGERLSFEVEPDKELAEVLEKL